MSKDVWVPSGVLGVFGPPGGQHDIFVTTMAVFQHCLCLLWSGLSERQKLPPSPQHLLGKGGQPPSLSHLTVGVPLH